MTQRRMNWGDVKVSLAALFGGGIQLTDIEVLVKIGVGLATIAYIVSKTVKLWHKKHKKE